MSFTKRVIGIGLAIILMAPIALPQQTDSASTALHEGRRLLKRGQADKALVQLRNALNLYTAAKNNSGMAGAHNELGNLYLRQGQYQIAVVDADNKIEVRPVKVGERVGGQWVIDQGLKPGEQVVVEGFQKVKAGMTVNPKPVPPPPDKTAG